MLAFTATRVWGGATPMALEATIAAAMGGVLDRDGAGAVTHSYHISVVHAPESQTNALTFCMLQLNSAEQKHAEGHE